MGAQALRTYFGPHCPACRLPIGDGQVSNGRMSCPRCARIFEAVAFAPPSPRVVRPDVAQEVAASCALHPLNAAAAACQRCGAFACELCRVAVDGQDLCAPCFERLRAEGALASVATRTVDYPGIAWLLVGSSIVFAIAIPVLAPAAIVAAALGLQSQAKLGETWARRSLVTAIVLACVLIAGFGAVVATSIGH